MMEIKKRRFSRDQEEISTDLDIDEYPEPKRTVRFDLSEKRVEPEPETIRETDAEDTSIFVDNESETTWQKLVFRLSDPEGIPRRFTFTFVLILLALGGSGIFFALEPVPGHIATGDSVTFDYWTSIFYCSTIFTTIGYGTIYPATTGGQIFTIMYALVVTPVYIMAISDMGKFLEVWTEKGWLRLVKCYRGQKVAPKTDDDTEDGTIVFNEQKFPIYLAILAFIIWTLICSSFFYAIQRNEWTYGDSLYFYLTSVSTIGLGDLATNIGGWFTLVNIIFIVIGIALFSMTIQLSQTRLRNLSKDIGDQIVYEYTEYLRLNMISMFEEQLDEREAADQAKDDIHELLAKRTNAVTRFLVGKGIENRMFAEYEIRANRRSSNTQCYQQDLSTTNDMYSEIYWEVCDKATQVSDIDFLSAIDEPEEEMELRKRPPRPNPFVLFAKEKRTVFRKFVIPDQRRTLTSTKPKRKIRKVRLSARKIEHLDQTHLLPEVIVKQ